MALELHVWGPAFSLPSIDPQCLAAIAYLSAFCERAESGLAWRLIASNDPSISPTKELPALRHKAGTVGGLPNIIEYLCSQYPAGDVDQDLDNDATTSADSIAFTAHILSRAPPLLDLSLFVSSENYTHTTRPTYSALLPWPTQYIIPPTLRARAKARTAHLGLSSLDLDAEDEAASERQRKSIIIPDSLRTTPKPPTTALTNQPNTSTRLHLNRLVDDFCLPLVDLLSTKPYLLSPTHPSTLDCLASAHLALMLCPNPPQPWLRLRIQQRWKLLAAYADRTALHTWGGDTRHLPWREAPPRSLLPTLAEHALSAMPIPFLNSPTRYSTLTDPPPTTTDADASTSSIPKQPQPPPHNLSTILITASAAAAGVAALSAYLVVPYLSAPLDEERREGGRSLGEMGEAGEVLRAVDFGIGRRGGDGEQGGVPVGGGGGCGCGVVNCRW